MRIRLVHSMSLLMLTFSSIAVLALGGFAIWGLRSDFGNYLLARDIVYLERFADVAGREIQRQGGIEVLYRGQFDIYRVLDGLAPPPIGARQQPDCMQPCAPSDLRPHPRALPIDAIQRRLRIFDLQGTLLTGENLAQAMEPDVDRPILINDKIVAFARLRTSTFVPKGSEAVFLRDQYLHLLITSIIIIIAGILTSLWMARQISSPIIAIRNATQKFSKGDLTTRVVPDKSYELMGQEIGDLVHHINNMAEGLEKIQGARRVWLAEISHELRTPLTILQGDIEALLDGVRLISRDRIVIIHEETLKLAKIVDDLHLLAMFDLRAISSYFTEGDVLEVVNKVLSRFQHNATASGLEIRLKSSNETATSVFWDMPRIEQALGIIVDNSIKYTDSPGRIEISIEKRDERVLIKIEDTVPTINETELQRIFEPFYRASRVTGSEPKSGSGLGLAICREIITAHGGYLQAECSLSGGLSICIDLPLSSGGHS